MYSLPRLLNRFVRPLLAGTVFFTQSLCAHVPESSVWAERRRVVQARSTGAAPALSDSLRVLNALPPPASHTPASAVRLRERLAPLKSGALSTLLSALPAQTGDVRKVVLPKGGAPSATVVIVQDVHANEEAQRNIGAIVQRLAGTEGGAGLVALEGAFGLLDLGPLRAVPDPEALRDVADHFLSLGRIPGPVHAALRGEVSVPLVGVDDPVHHPANVAAYLAAEKRALAARDGIAVRRAALETEKARTFHPALKALDEGVQAYRSGRSSLNAYVRLIALSPARPLAPSVRNFLNALDMEESLDFAQVQAQRTELLQTLTQRLTPASLEELLRVSMAYRLGNVRHGDFHRFLRGLCAGAGVPLDGYPAVEGYVRYALAADAIDASELLTALGRLEADRFSALTATPEEKRLASESRRLFLASRLADFSLTPEEWTEYSGMRPDPDLVPFEGFYREAGLRDAAIAENVRKAMEANKTASAVLVAGGFHTDGVASRLAAGGTACVVVTPKLTKVDAAGGAYLSVFSREKTPLEKLFAGERLFLAQHPLPPSTQGEIALETGNLHEARTPDDVPASREREAIKDILPEGTRLVEHRDTPGGAEAELKTSQGETLLLRTPVTNGKISGPSLTTAERDFWNVLTQLRPFLLRQARRFARGDAEDLVQDTLERALQNRDTFEGRNLKGWVYQIMMNQWRNEVKRSRRFKSLVGRVAADPSVLRHFAGDGPPSPEQISQWTEVWRSRQTVLKSVAPEMRRPFELLLEGRSYIQIADDLNIPIGTVKSRINRMSLKLGLEKSDGAQASLTLPDTYEKGRTFFQFFGWSDPPDAAIEILFSPFYELRWIFQPFTFLTEHDNQTEEEKIGWAKTSVRALGILALYAAFGAFVPLDVTAGLAVAILSAEAVTLGGKVAERLGLRGADWNARVWWGPAAAFFMLAMTGTGAAVWGLIAMAGVHGAYNVLNALVRAVVSAATGGRVRWDAALSKKNKKKKWVEAAQRRAVGSGAQMNRLRPGFKRLVERMRDQNEKSGVLIDIHPRSIGMEALKKFHGKVAACTTPFNRMPDEFKDADARRVFASHLRLLGELEKEMAARLAASGHVTSRYARAAPGATLPQAPIYTDSKHNEATTAQLDGALDQARKEGRELVLVINSRKMVKVVDRLADMLDEYGMGYAAYQGASEVLATTFALIEDKAFSEWMMDVRQWAGPPKSDQPVWDVLGTERDAGVDPVSHAALAEWVRRRRREGERIRVVAAEGGRDAAYWGLRNGFKRAAHDLLNGRVVTTFFDQDIRGNGPGGRNLKDMFSSYVRLDKEEEASIAGELIETAKRVEEGPENPFTVAVIEKHLAGLESPAAAALLRQSGSNDPLFDLADACPLDEYGNPIPSEALLREVYYAPIIETAAWWIQKDERCPSIGWANQAARRLFDLLEEEEKDALLAGILSAENQGEEMDPVKRLMDAESLWPEYPAKPASGPAALAERGMRGYLGSSRLLPPGGGEAGRQASDDDAGQADATEEEASSSQEKIDPLPEHLRPVVLGDFEKVTRPLLDRLADEAKGRELLLTVQAPPLLGLEEVWGLYIGRYGRAPRNANLLNMIATRDFWEWLREEMGEELERRLASLRERLAAGDLDALQSSELARWIGERRAVQSVRVDMSPHDIFNKAWFALFVKAGKDIASLETRIPGLMQGGIKGDAFRTFAKSLISFQRTLQIINAGDAARFALENDAGDEGPVVIPVLKIGESGLELEPDEAARGFLSRAGDLLDPIERAAMTTNAKADPSDEALESVYAYSVFQGIVKNVQGMSQEEARLRANRYLSSRHRQQKRDLVRDMGDRRKKDKQPASQAHFNLLPKFKGSETKREAPLPEDRRGVAAYEALALGGQEEDSREQAGSQTKTKTESFDDSAQTFNETPGEESVEGWMGIVGYIEALKGGKDIRVPASELLALGPFTIQTNSVKGIDFGKRMVCSLPEVPGGTPVVITPMAVDPEDLSRAVFLRLRAGEKTFYRDFKRGPGYFAGRRVPGIHESVAYVRALMEGGPLEAVSRDLLRTGPFSITALDSHQLYFGAMGERRIMVLFLREVPSGTPVRFTPMPIDAADLSKGAYLKAEAVGKEWICDFEKVPNFIVLREDMVQNAKAAKTVEYAEAMAAGAPLGAAATALVEAGAYDVQTSLSKHIVFGKVDGARMFIPIMGAPAGATVRVTPELNHPDDPSRGAHLRIRLPDGEEVLCDFDDEAPFLARRTLEDAVDRGLEIAETILSADLLPFFAARYSLDVKTLLWGLMPSQLEGTYDQEQIEELINRRILDLAKENEEAAPGLEGLVPTPEGGGPGPRRLEDIDISQEDIARIARKLEENLLRMTADKALADISRKQARAFLYKLEEKFFFKTQYQPEPNRPVGEEALEALDDLLDQESTPLIRETLGDLREEIEAAIALQNRLYERGLNKDTHLNLYQLVAVKRMAEGKRMILADEMGLGKTLETICVFLLSGEKEMLVAAPGMAMNRWMDDLARHTDLDLELVMLTTRSPANSLGSNKRIQVNKDLDTPEKRFDYLLNPRPPSPAGRRIMLVHYESLHNLQKRKTAMGQSRAPPVGFIALDEAHEIKKASNPTTQAIYGNGKGEGAFEAEHKIIMTGTPLENKPSDLLPHLRFLAQGGDWETKSDEEKYFASLDAKDFGRAFPRADLVRASKLQSYITERMIRRLKADVVRDLPRKAPIVVKLNPYTGIMSVPNQPDEKLPGRYGRQADLYDMALQRPNDFEQRFAHGVPLETSSDEPQSGGKTQLIRLDQVALTPALFREKGADSIKFDAAARLIDERVINQDKSVLIFTDFKEGSLAFREHLVKKHNYLPEDIAYIDGDVPFDEREKLIERYQNGEIKILVATTGTAGASIELTQADTVMFLSLPWKPSDLDQAVDRAHRLDALRNRPGKVLEIIHFELDVPLSIDRMKAQIIQRKRILSEMIVEANLAREILAAFEKAEEGPSKAIQEKTASPVALDGYETGVVLRFRQKLGQILHTADMEERRRLWDEAADFYVELLEHKASFFANMASLDYISRIPELQRKEDEPSLRALDLASGPSTLYRAYLRQEKRLRDRGFRLDVTDYDLSPRMLSLGLRRDDQIVGAIQDVGKAFSEDAFDLVNFAYAFRYAASPAQLVTDIHRLLDEGGAFPIILPESTIIPRRFYKAMAEAGFDLMTVPGQQTLESKLDPQKYADLAKEFGVEFADDVAATVRGRFTYFLARKSAARAPQGDLKDEDFRLGRTTPPLDIQDKVRKLAASDGRYKIAPVQAEVEGILRSSGEKRQAGEKLARRDRARRLRKLISAAGMATQQFGSTQGAARKKEAARAKAADKVGRLKEFIEAEMGLMGFSERERLVTDLSSLRESEFSRLWFNIDPTLDHLILALSPIAGDRDPESVDPAYEEKLAVGALTLPVTYRWTEGVLGRFFKRLGLKSSPPRWLVRWTARLGVAWWYEHNDSFDLPVFASEHLKEGTWTSWRRGGLWFGAGLLWAAGLFAPAALGYWSHGGVGLAAGIVYSIFSILLWHVNRGGAGRAGPRPAWLLIAGHAFGLPQMAMHLAWNVLSILRLVPALTVGKGPEGGRKERGPVKRAEALGSLADELSSGGDAAEAVDRWMGTWGPLLDGLDRPGFGRAFADVEEAVLGSARGGAVGDVFETALEDASLGVLVVTERTTAEAVSTALALSGRLEKRVALVVAAEHGALAPGVGALLSGRRMVLRRPGLLKKVPGLPAELPMSALEALLDGARWTEGLTASIALGLPAGVTVDWDGVRNPYLAQAVVVILDAMLSRAAAVSRAELDALAKAARIIAGMA